MRKKAAPPVLSAKDRATALRFFIEDVGVQFETAGMPRMAGRILGHLLVCDPPHQTAEDLARAIQSSRASVSTMTRLLIQTGLVARLVLPGNRRDQFLIRPEAFAQNFHDKLRLITIFRQMLDRGLQALAGEPEERSARLREMHDMYIWMEREMPLLFERYEREVLRKRGG